MPTDIPGLLSQIDGHLQTTFSRLDAWFDHDPALLYHKPPGGGWSPALVLEHVGLTNHFLLILIEKATRKALHKAQEPGWEAALAGYNFPQAELDVVGVHGSFPWMRPEHMEPSGERTMEAIRMQLKTQLDVCRDTLLQLSKGEGILYQTTMTVNGIGKIDAYAYLYFLSQHGRRHLTQLDGIADGFAKGNTR